MHSPDLSSPRVSAAATGRPWYIVPIVCLTGFFAVMLLGIGLLFLAVRGAQANIEFAFTELGSWAHFTLHRVGLGITLVVLGAWFTLVTRGLWQGRRYGRVLGWATVALVAAIAILVAVT